MSREPNHVPGQLPGRVALITGGSRGIGLAAARQLVREGVRVCITGRDQQALDLAVEALGGPEHALGVVGNGADPARRTRTVEQVLETWGRIDHLVCNVGINPVHGPLIGLDPAAARKIVDTNCIATLEWIQEVHRAWFAGNGGSIVVVSSVAGLRASPGIGWYGASKALLLNLTETLAVELAPTVRVNAVAPAVVRTAFSTAIQDREDEVAARYPLQRLGEADDVAEAIVFLLSERASWITGQTMVLDGGVTLEVPA